MKEEHALKCAFELPFEQWKYGDSTEKNDLKWVTYFSKSGSIILIFQIIIMIWRTQNSELCKWKYFDQQLYLKIPWRIVSKNDKNPPEPGWITIIHQPEHRCYHLLSLIQIYISWWFTSPDPLLSMTITNYGGWIPTDTGPLWTFTNQHQSLLNPLQTIPSGSFLN